MDNYKLYINGKYVNGDSGEFISVENPADRQIFARVPDGNQADVDRAVAAARAAFPKWSALSPEERADYVGKFADYIERHKDEVGKTITSEIGTPVKYVYGLQVVSSIEQARYYSDLARNYSYSEKCGNNIVRKEPIGVIACLTPWNYPIYQETSKIFPAIAAGNCIVLKPSQLAPVSAYVLSEAAEEIGLPPGVINIVTGRGEQVGTLLSKHEDVDMVSFTGSTQQGKKVGMMGIESNVKKIALELGGKSASVILRSADYEKAAVGTMMECFLNTGQTCSALTRLIAPREIKDDLENFMLTFVKELKVGDPNEPDTRIGPLASEKGFHKVNRYIRLGIEEGAKMICGEIPDDYENGYYVQPVIFTDVTNDMVIAQEEIFGPVMGIIYYDTEEEALEIANDSIYGLAGAVFGDEKEALEFAEKIQAGTVLVNGGAFTIDVPFGGYKQPGIGRENGKCGFDEFMEVKSIRIG